MNLPLSLSHLLVNILVALEFPSTAMIEDTLFITQEISGTLQITSDNAQALRTLLDPSATIPGGFANWWTAFWFVLMFGALGGIVFELLRLRGGIVIPNMLSLDQLNKNRVLYEQDGYVTPSKAYDLGVVARVFVGAMAALAILLVITPATPLKLFASAVIAGSAGASIFDMLRARLQASLAIADAATVRAHGEEVNKKLEAMKPIIEALEGSLLHQGLSDQGNLEMHSDDTADGDHFDAKLLNELNRLLGEAKGASDSMHHISSPTKYLGNQSVRETSESQ